MPFIQCKCPICERIYKRRITTLDKEETDRLKSRMPRIYCNGCKGDNYRKIRRGIPKFGTLTF